MLFGKVKKILCSVKTTIAILISFALLSAIGTLVPQGLMTTTHEAEAPSRLFSILQTLQLHDVFHSFWFVILTTLLALNLIFCTWYRLLAKPAPGQNGDGKITVPVGEPTESFDIPRNYSRRNPAHRRTADRTVPAPGPVRPGG